VLHYKALFKADGYSMGDLIYSLPLAPGQKKQIVVFDASHTLAGAEVQSISQNERLAAGLVNERDITSQIAGGLSESLRGSSSANTSGISAGFGTGAQGSASAGAYGGSGSADSKPISIAGRRYTYGLGVRARSEIKYALDDNYDMFRAIVGIETAISVPLLPSVARCSISTSPVEFLLAHESIASP